jgi:hypothetical protein
MERELDRIKKERTPISEILFSQNIITSVFITT